MLIQLYSMVHLNWLVAWFETYLMMFIQLLYFQIMIIGEMLWVEVKIKKNCKHGYMYGTTIFTDIWSFLQQWRCWL
jgi:hypothetical protein